MWEGAQACLGTKIAKRWIFEVPENNCYILAYCTRIESDTVIFFAPMLAIFRHICYDDFILVFSF